MATHLFSRTFVWKLTTTKAIASLLSRSFSSKPSSPSLSLFFLNRLRPLSAVNVGRFGGVAGPTVRGMATRGATSSLNDSSPNWSNRPPKETILLDGCDFEHWLVVMEKPEGDPTRDEIIDRYIKTLASVVGSEEEARMKVYSVSTRCYFAFGALVDEETSYKLKELPGVRWVLPDSYLDVKNKDYGGEPFINGQAVPYDPKYHEEWIRNNSRANERNRRNDRPRNFDRSRNFERRRENMQNREFQNHGMQNPASNINNMPPNSLPPNTNVPPNMGRTSQYNMGGPPPANNFDGPPPANNFGGGQPPPNNFGGAQPPPNSNFGGAQPPPNSNFGGAQPPPNRNFGGAQLPPNSNFGGAQPPPNSNFGGAQPPPNSNFGGAQPPPSNFGGAQPPPSYYAGAQPPPSYHGGAQPPPSYHGGAQPPPSYHGGAQPPPNNFGGGAQPPPNNFGGGAQPPPNNFGGAQPPPNNFGGGAQPPPNNFGGGAQPPPNYNTGNIGGMPQNAGWSDIKPGNMQQSADGHTYQNSYTPRQ